jgi:hypothetical protein
MRFTDTLMRNPEFKSHLFSTSSLLDDSEAHRSHWFYGNGDFSRLTVAYEWLTRGKYGGFNAPLGRILVFDSETIWGVYGHGEKSELFACDIHDRDKQFKKDFPSSKGEKHAPRLWKTELKLHPRAMLKAGARLYIAGATEADQLLNTKPGGQLIIASDKDGSTISTLALDAPPVFDGIAAATDRLYMSQVNGNLVCFGAESMIGSK